MVLSGPILFVSNKEELEKAKQGVLTTFFHEQRPALTIGTFNLPESEDLKKLKTAASLLNGRYHIVAWISPAGTFVLS